MLIEVIFDGGFKCPVQVKSAAKVLVKFASRVRGFEKVRRPKGTQLLFYFPTRSFDLRSAAVSTY